MKRSRRNIYYHELIGLRVKVIDHLNPSCIGLEGIIKWETKNTIVIETIKGERKIIKKDAVLLLTLPEGNVVVRGEHIIGRPEERAKKARMILKR